jgi:hypothetical protein
MTRSRRPQRHLLPTIVRPLALLLLAAAPLHAQRCLGFPGFGNQPMRLDGALTTGGSVTTLGADLAFGQAAGAFGSVGLGVANYDNVHQSALLVSGSIGSQVQLGTPSRGSPGAQLCPVAAIQYQNGPNVGDVDQNALTLRGGVSLGTSLAMTPAVRLAPFGTISAAYVRSSFSSPRGSGSSSDIGGILDLGAGFIFSNRFTIRPSVGIPIGFENSDARFGIVVGYNFGR